MFSFITKIHVILLVFFTASTFMFYLRLYVNLINKEVRSREDMQIKQRHTIGVMSIPMKQCTCNVTINITGTEDQLSDENTPFSNCGTYATLRGLGQKVISFSIYGGYPSDYHKGLERLIPLVNKYYQGWIIRVYHDGYLWQSYGEHDWACKIICNNTHVDFCDTSNLPELGNVTYAWGSLWRFIVVGDPTVERYIVRDLDSPILQREVDAVHDWIDSGKCYHVMRDNQNHGVPMMAGMWGGCNTWQLSSSTAPKILREKMLLYGTSINLDQPALEEFMWPQVQMNGLQHDSFTCMRFLGSKPFPTKRDGNTFVGMRTYKRGYEYDGIRRTCPEICRPPDHMDWEEC